MTNNVPADVRIETYVRGKTIDAIIDANKKVNRALRAGAKAIGAEVEVTERPGYMPLHKNPELTEVLKKNGSMLLGEDHVVEGDHATASNDGGDISSIIPTCARDSIEDPRTFAPFVLG